MVKKIMALMLSAAVVLALMPGIAWTQEAGAASKPGRVKWAAAGSTAYSVTLKWKKAARAGGYSVYQKKNGKYRRIKNTARRSYAVRKLRPSAKYRFYVKAYKKAGGKKVYGKRSSISTVRTAAKKAADTKLNIRNGQTQPCVDETKLISERLWIEAPVDSDRDGKRDLVYARITRPGETENGLRAASLIRVSPYNGVDYEGGDSQLFPVDRDYEGQGNPDTTSLKYGDVETHPHTYADILGANFNPSWLPAQRISVGSGQADRIDPWLSSKNWRQYFIARGYAAIDICSLGDNDSEGSVTVGSYDEAVAAAAVVDWLNGRVKAYTKPDRGSGYVEVKAGWSNGKAAMEGGSYEGSLPIMAASTGVEGLETIIPQCAPYNWYDYYRENGGLSSPGGYQGEDMIELHTFCQTRDNTDLYQDLKTVPDAGTAETIAGLEEEMKRKEDRGTFDYNSYWDERNMAKYAGDIRCSIMMAYGLNDDNVKLKNAALLAEACRANNITCKVLLQPAKHNSIRNFDGIDIIGKYHGWLDHYLYGLNNGMPDTMADTTLYSNSDYKWKEYNKWPMYEGREKTYYVDADAADSRLGSLSAENPSAAAGEASFRDSYIESVPAGSRAEKFGYCNKETPDEGEGMTEWMNTVFCGDKGSDVPDTNKSVKDRLLYTTGRLDADLHISGTAKITVRARADANTGTLSAMLVDYGEIHGIKYDDGTVIDLGNGSSMTLEKPVKSAKTVSYKMVTQGSVDIQNPNPSGEVWMNCAGTNYIPGYIYQTTAVGKDKYHDYTFTLNSAEYTVAAGHRLGLIIYGSDARYSIRPYRSPEITVDLDKVKLALPAR